MRSLVASIALLLAGCGGVSLWPFGEKGTELSRVPANAVEYKCEENKAFYVRSVEDGAVWLIAPDREIRLPKLAAGGYGAGRTVLELNGDNATLTDPPSRFANCKRAAKTN
jgi:membrane-bound inhibitor of C-type lysozyme